MRLSELKLKQQATIKQIHQHYTEAGKDGIASRLSSLGFVPGEAIEIETKGLFGGEPILVKIGFTRFALRLNEAERIEVEI